MRRKEKTLSKTFAPYFPVLLDLTPGQFETKALHDLELD